jgi:alcohol dehydrogenase class IV
MKTVLSDSCMDYAFGQELSQFRFPVDMRFGIGARRSLSDFAHTFNARKPLLVTDTGLVGTQAFQLAKRQIEKTGYAYALFSSVHANPSDHDVEQAWICYQENQCDSVIGLGGGSGLDAARAMRLKAVYPELPVREIPCDRLPDRLIPFCAIPTTSGTGSEVGRSSVITISQSNRKVILGAPALLADLAILDPELTVGLPAHLTAYTGMDALTHAVESYVCPIFHPICDAIALEAIRLVCRNLPIAYADGQNIQARGMMQIAAAMGAIAFQKDLGAAHALSHSLSSLYGIQHGLANAISLPAVVRFNGQENSARYERIAQAMSLDPGSDPAADVAACLRTLNSRLGITQRLRDLKVPKEKLAELADHAFEDPCHLTNPRKCGQTDLLKLYEEIW